LSHEAGVGIGPAEGLEETMKRIFSLLAMVLALATAAAPARAADTDAGKIAVAREMIAAWKAADWRKVAREAVYERVAALGKGAPGGVVLDVSHIGVIDGLVFIERTDRFVYNGHAGATPVVGVLDIRDGKVQEWREYYDRASLMHEMGVDAKK
jgi:limonene-1,2-epoxide hydrolase